jgi:quinoprotein glucose dehydrogenase
MRKHHEPVVAVAPLRAIAATAAILLALLAGSVRAQGGATEWPSYGGDSGGQRFADLADITPANVDDLEIAWVHRHGDVSDGKPPFQETSAFEGTPILVDGTLFYCTPFNRVIALDPATGAERWTFDPDIDIHASYSNQLVCRGVSTWLDAERETGAVCRRRIFTGTNSSELIALDAATGKPCPDFGKDGRVNLLHGPGEPVWVGEYHVTSPPAVVGRSVVVGSAIGDNQRTDAPSGVVRAYDARTGALRWAWDPVRPGTPPAEGELYVRGTANVWAPMAVDEARDLVFLPTGNSAPDYFGGHRNGKDDYASSLVALRGSTGELVWHFQTVHHDLWDFDVPAQPTLLTLERDGVQVPAVVQATKMGFLFVLHRETGEPLFPVEERPVPQGGVEGEKLSPTQPFPVKPPPLVRQTLSPEEAWGVTPWDRASCRRLLESLRFDGIYTPPSLQGTLTYPGNAGGMNWGGLAVDPKRRWVVARNTDVPWVVRLFPAAEFERERGAHPGEEVSPQRGTPYGMHRTLALSSLGLPCNPPPWGTLSAVDLNTGEIVWQVAHGTVRDLAPIPLPIELGVPGTGGPLVTGSGLVFIAAAMDDYLRAFELATGKELWKGRLPAGGQATPMSYRAGGRQFVVIAAGGHGRAGTRLGDSLVAFALPR